MRWSVSLTVLALALAIAAAGCGGGDSGGDRLTATEFADQANAICKDFNGKIDDLGTPATVAELGDYADKAIPIFEDGLDDLHALEPPETIEESVDAWLATGDAALERVRKVRDAAKDGDEAEVGRLTREAAAAERGSDALARQVGATTCAED